MSKQDRQGARTPAQLDQQYKFGRTFADLMGLAEDAQKEAQEAKNVAAEGRVYFESEVLRLDDRIELTVKKTETVQESADQAKNEALAAQAAANKANADAAAAQETANTANAAAANAQAAADTAAMEAQKAQNAADAANDRAVQAEEDLAEAKGNLQAVTSRVDATEEEIVAAQAAVSAAQAAADAANADVKKAQETANEANNAAANAQTAANKANADAAVAQEAAAEANDAAARAQKTADDAQAGVNNLGLRVTTAETKILQNAEAITLRATKKEISDNYYDKTETEELIAAPKITGQNTQVVTVENALSDSIEGLTLYGKTTQDGTPSPENPVPLESVGDSGSVAVSVSNPDNLLPAAIEKEVTQHGLTFTSYRDGSYTVKGTKNISGASSVYFPLPSDVHFPASGILYFQPRSNTGHTAMTFAFQTVTETGAYKQLGYRSFQENVLHDVNFLRGQWIRAVSIYIATNDPLDITLKPSIRYASSADAARKDFVESKYQALTVSTPNGLPGIPVSSGGNYTDASGQQWICDEIDFARGVYVKRIANVSLAGAKCNRSEYPSGSGIYRLGMNISQNPTFLPGVANYGGYCTGLKVNGATLDNNSVDNAISPYTGGGLWARCDAFDTTEAFVAAATAGNWRVQYVLAEPIETALSAEEMAAFKALSNPAGNVTVYSEADLSVELSGGASSGALEKTKQDVAQTKQQVVELSLRADGIEMSVQEVNNTAATAQKTADDAKNAANEAKGEIVSMSTTYAQRADAVDLSVKELRQVVGTKADQTQVNEITEHFRFAADGMTITNSATGMGINVSEQQVAFTGGNDPTTVITPNAMETTNLSVGIRLDVGGFSLFPRNNGNLSLRWKGG